MVEALVVIGVAVVVWEAMVVVAVAAVVVPGLGIVVEDAVAVGVVATTEPGVAFELAVVTGAAVVTGSLGVTGPLYVTHRVPDACTHFTSWVPIGAEIEFRSANFQPSHLLMIQRSSPSQEQIYPPGLQRSVSHRALSCGPDVYRRQVPSFVFFEHAHSVAL